MPAMPQLPDAARWLTAWQVGGLRRDTSLHAHSFGQWLGVASGLHGVLTATARWLVGPAQALWLPSGLAHAGQSHGAFVGWSLYVAPERAAELPDEPFLVASGELLPVLVARMAAWPAAQSWSAREARLADVCWDECLVLPRSTAALPLPADARLRRVTEAIAREPGDQRDIAAWAALAAMSTRSFIRHFSAETGLSFSAWRQRVRLQAAQQRLARGEPVGLVALEVGYDSVGAFSTAFRRATGLTPSAYAAEVGRTPDRP